MIRIGQVSIALLGWIVFSVFAVLLPSAAQAACSQWDVSGEWVFVQSNNTSPRFTLQQTGTGLQGSASYSHRVDENGCIGVNCDHLETVSASVDGTIDGDSLEINAYWNNGTIGVYTAKIGSQGRIQGSGYDRLHPQTMANWYSDRTAKCLTGAGGVSPSSITPPVGATLPPPVKPAARVKGPSGTVVKSVLSTCQAAWRARARNSPAAPGLEESCRAMGGTPTAP
jgi:hypothetical protein